VTTTTPDLRDLGDEEFVQLTTFRRSGRPVHTPVWVVPEGDSLLVTTPSGSGKVKRLRRDPRVELRPCSRRGHVEPGAPTVPAVAALDADPAAHEREAHRFAGKYGWQYRVAMLVEHAIVTVRRTPGPARRILRITPAATEPAATEAGVTEPTA
jgi:PPOX class probable F420-dependent enzyme